MNIIVKLKEFSLYQEINKSYYLDKDNGYILYYPSKSIVLGHNINEIFEGTICDYKIMNESNNYILLFSTINGIEYRIDLIKDTIDDYLLHICFSLANRTDIDYEELTNNNESLEVFSKIIFILKDFDIKIDSPLYCIGATGNIKKDRIYQYMMRYISGWEKKKTNSYSLGWGLFFKLNNNI